MGKTVRFNVLKVEKNQIFGNPRKVFIHRFGLGLFNGARQMAVGGDELYVCDTKSHRLQVFSLTGEHRRSIVGEWRSPQYLCFAKDRLYLLEQSNREAPVQGRRILVLS